MDYYKRLVWKKKTTIISCLFWKNYPCYFKWQIKSSWSVDGLSEGYTIP